MPPRHGRALHFYATASRREHKTGPTWGAKLPKHQQKLNLQQLISPIRGDRTSWQKKQPRETTLSLTLQKIMFLHVSATELRVSNVVVSLIDLFWRMVCSSRWKTWRKNHKHVLMPMFLHWSYHSAPLIIALYTRTVFCTLNFLGMVVGLIDLSWLFG